MNDDTLPKAWGVLCVWGTEGKKTTPTWRHGTEDLIFLNLVYQPVMLSGHITVPWVTPEEF